MTSKELAQKVRLEQWAQAMRERSESGESVRAWCASNGINEKTFYYWQRKLREAAAQQLAGAAEPRKDQQTLIPNGWAQACIAEECTAAQAGSLTLRVGGAEIEVRQGFDEALLASVIKTLSRSC